jgi:spore germination cell wall hydrolase CwlJ-like protein
MDNIQSITKGLLYFTLGVMFVNSFFVFGHYLTTLYTSKITKPVPEVAVTKDTLATPRQLECLTRNIYYEAATEPFEGKLAVAQVTVNRARSDTFPNDICQVVYQKTYKNNKKPVCQFSWYCKQTNMPIYYDNYLESEKAARKILMEGFMLEKVKGALYYHADYVHPNWNKQRVAKIGRHIFYK